mgnify:CR=1 FL=1
MSVAEYHYSWRPMRTAAASHLSPAFPDRAAWGPASKLPPRQADAPTPSLPPVPPDPASPPRTPSHSPRAGCHAFPLVRSRYRAHAPRHRRRRNLRSAGAYVDIIEEHLRRANWRRRSGYWKVEWLSDKQTFVQWLHNSKRVGIRAQPYNPRLQLIETHFLKVAQLRAGAVLRSLDS